MVSIWSRRTVLALCGGFVGIGGCLRQQTALSRPIDIHVFNHADEERRIEVEISTVDATIRYAERLTLTPGETYIEADILSQQDRYTITVRGPDTDDTVFRWEAANETFCDRIEVHADGSDRLAVTVPRCFDHEERDDS
ncbi:hypothetical protein [Natronocalculus amylovorans]|uniref:Ig-like domain-containing protein n=1 Tax=Natronocalculus amylovorans TaxID=2917812 RepID=A0AAE3K7F6_9EURY|nr:hypothetical protein [Natronocalculus amylovorans]MCL9815953.1 hypothetical protein [Natronocalculus amylovorans]NUE01531.1 hypothetical protein [Halorubraceae archaeon YAN]